MLVSTTTTATTTPASRALTTLYKKTLSNKGVADLSTVKYYNYNKFGYYATSCHERMNRDWESQLNCLYYDDIKLKKEEGS